MNPLTQEEKTRLARYEERPPETDEERLDEIELRTRRSADDKARAMELIPLVFPEKHGGERVRGRLNEVVAASGYTREYVARIRDGKVKP